ncbi:hypothetical protein AMTRI_Chr12g273770 [Amborella trichopoda]
MIILQGVSVLSNHLGCKQYDSCSRSWGKIMSVIHVLKVSLNYAFLSLSHDHGENFNDRLIRTRKWITRKKKYAKYHMLDIILHVRCIINIMLCGNQSNVESNQCGINLVKTDMTASYVG